MALPKLPAVTLVATAMMMMTALIPSAARACGVSTADGLSACSLSEHEEETRPRWQAGASGIYTSTAIRFMSNLRSDETRSAVVASIAYHPSAQAAFQLALGGTFGGRLATPGGNYDFSPGATAAVGASWRLLERARSFVVVTSNLSFSAARTTLSTDGATVGLVPPGPGDGSAGYQAFDLRVGALVGTTLLNVLSPYAVGRVFGGPIFWKYQGAAVTGTDTHHYQVGAGLSLAIVRRFSLFAEGIPLGERSLAAGTAIAF